MADSFIFDVKMTHNGESSIPFTPPACAQLTKKASTHPCRPPVPRRYARRVPSGSALKEQTRLPTRPPSRHTRAPTRPAHIRVAAPAPAPVCAQALSTSRHLGQRGRRRRRESLRSPDEITTSMGGVGAVALEHNVVNPQMCARRSQTLSPLLAARLRLLSK